MEYVIRHIFKALFQQDRNAMFQWFIDRCATKMMLTRILIKETNRCKRRSTEKRVLQAVLQLSFTRYEIDALLKDQKFLFDDFEQEKKSEEKRATSSCGREDGAGGNDVGNHGEGNRTASDDEILDIMSEEGSDGDFHEQDDDDVNDRDEEDDGLMPDLFTKVNAESGTGV